MNRREFLSLAAGCALEFASLNETNRMMNRSDRLNFLWIIAEDIGPTALSCYGQTAVRTPHLDRLAREGVRYDRFYTTAPVCSPSRSAFMTGMYQTTIGAHHHRSHREQAFPLPEGVRLITGWMRDAGYVCGNIDDLPAEMGFRGTGKTDWNFSPGERPFDFHSWSDLPQSAPFLGQINLWETHRDFAGERRADRNAVKLPPYYPDIPIVREDYARYLDSAAELDRKVGAILARLVRDGLAERTVVIFMGDNGESHIRGKQFCYEEGLRVPMIIRFPEGVQPPEGYRKGSTDRRLIEAIDLAPTLLRLAGAEDPAKMQGRPFLGEKRTHNRRYAFGARDRCDETVMRIRTVRDSRFRYIRNFMPEKPFLSPNSYKASQYPLWMLLPQLQKEGKLTPVQEALCAPHMPSEELYDLEADPHEVSNLAKDARYAKKLEEMRQVLDRWITETNDQGRFLEAVAH